MDSAPASESDRTAQLLSNITQSLLNLFDTNEPFVITNESMRVLLLGLSQRLEEAVKANEEDELFRNWNEHMTTTKKYLLDIARVDPLYLADGYQMPVMREGKAEQFLRNCLPDPPQF